jgi:hypothetical protein
MPGHGQYGMPQQMMAGTAEAKAKRVTCFHCDKKIEEKECIEVVHWGPSKRLGHRAERVFHVECFEELAGTAHIPPLPETRDPIDELDHIPEDLKQKLREILLEKKVNQLEKVQAQYEKQKMKDSFYKGLSDAPEKYKDFPP